MSFLTYLECVDCHDTFDPSSKQTYCTKCKATLLVNYDLKAAHYKLDRDAFLHRPNGMWRWNELLPIHESTAITSLGEGDTPLLHLARLGDLLNLPSLYVKDESINPTGSFKARGMSAAVSKARELGIKKVVMPTAGNAGGALAAYAARAGIEALIYMPNDTPSANIVECRISGATVVCVTGLISDAAIFAQKKAIEDGYFDMSTFKEPYRTEGKKIMGYELAEAFKWVLPDVIIYPAGGGTGLIGLWKAFNELSELGWLESAAMPRMIAVQSEGCAPIVKAMEMNLPYCEFWEQANTIASGLRVPKSFADKLILQYLRESEGTAIAVSDSDIVSAQRQLASTEGIFASPEGAATLAGLIKLVRMRKVAKHEKIVLFNTATGLKYTVIEGNL